MHRACVIENMDNNVIEKNEVEFLRNTLPKFMNTLSEREKSMIQMKFFDGYSGRQIAEKFSITESRVTQITRSALAKLGKAYLDALDTENENPHSH